MAGPEALAWPARALNHEIGLSVIRHSAGGSSTQRPLTPAPLQKLPLENAKGSGDELWAAPWPLLVPPRCLRPPVQVEARRQALCHHLGWRTHLAQPPGRGPTILGGARAEKVRGRPPGDTISPSAARAGRGATKLEGERATAWGHHHTSSLWPPGAAVEARSRTPPWDAIVEIPETSERGEDQTADHRAHVEEETRPEDPTNEDPNRDHQNAIDRDRRVPSDALPRTRPGRGWRVTVSLVAWHPGAGQEGKPSPRRS